MYATTYHRPTSVEAAAALVANNDEAKLLAGGQTLLPTMKQRLAAPSDVIDISRIDGLAGVTVAGNSLVIGAATTHYAVSTNADVRRLCPALASLAAGIGDPPMVPR